MTIPEDQLAAWTKLGSVQQSSSTYQSVKCILEQRDAPYSAKSIDCFLQGSYGNDTNIIGDSDVDIVLRTRALFYYDIDALPESQKAEFRRIHPHPAQYQLSDFRRDVVDWLSLHFRGELDISSTKVLKVPASGSRRSSDILLVAPHKTYTRYLSNRREDHERGIIRRGAAPSYFLEGALSNVPQEQFGKSCSDTLINTFSWIEGNEPARHMCANRIHPLIRDNNSTSWPIQNYIDWLAGVKRLWNSW